MKVNIPLPKASVDFFDVQIEKQAETMAKLVAIKLHEPEWSKMLEEIVQKAADEVIAELRPLKHY